MKKVHIFVKQNTTVHKVTQGIISKSSKNIPII